MSVAERHAVAWTFHALEFQAELPALEAVLSEEERERANRFVRPDLRLAYVVGRGLVRWLLAAEMGYRAEEVPIIYGSKGKPMVRGGAPASFNLSRSNGCIAIVLGHGTEAGIDVERIRAGEWPDLARRYFAPAEAEYIRTQPPGERDRAFFEIWTRKEAYVKAVGDGLSLPLESFRVPTGAISDDGAARIDDGRGDWCTFPLEMEDGFVGACVLAAGTRLVHHRRRPDVTP